MPLLLQQHYGRSQSARWRPGLAAMCHPALLWLLRSAPGAPGSLAAWCRVLLPCAAALLLRHQKGGRLALVMPSSSWLMSSPSS